MSLTHSPTRSLGGMVAAAHPLASAAGSEILRANGNAFDAAVATVATLNVVEPFMSGLAGLGVATCWTEKEKRIRCLDFTPNVPKDFLAEQLNKESTNTGPSASGVPGNLAGWCVLLEKYGSKSLAEVLAPSIRHAREGFPVSNLYIHMANLTAPRACTSEWRQVYMSGLDSIEENWILRQPMLAETLEAIASEGAQFLYQGPLGREMVSHIQSLGGCMSIADLEMAKPEWQDPLSAWYKDLLINVPPPPAEAFQFPLTMRILDGLDLASLEHLGVDHLDRVLRSIRLAAGIRILNNNRTTTEIMGLMTESAIEPLRGRVLDPSPIIGLTEQYEPNLDPVLAEARSHTTSISVADRQGNMVCSFMNWGDLYPESPNYLLGGKRWAMCLSPSISMRDGVPILALGTPGSYGIMQTQVQALVHHIDYGLNLRESIEAPRARLFDGQKVVLENRVSNDVVSALRLRGHDVELPGPFTMQCGGMQAVGRDPSNGALTGAADPRRDGIAIGV